MLNKNTRLAKLVRSVLFNENLIVKLPQLQIWEYLHIRHTNSNPLTKKVVTFKCNLSKFSFDSFFLPLDQRFFHFQLAKVPQILPASKHFILIFQQCSVIHLIAKLENYEKQNRHKKSAPVPPCDSFQDNQTRWES